MWSPPPLLANKDVTSSALSGPTHAFGSAKTFPADWYTAAFQ
jgi:hypothetical protein